MTMTVRNVQDEIIAGLQELLAPIAQVEEGDVRAIFDAEDEALPEEFIVLQPGTTTESAGPHPRMPRSVPEDMVVNVVLVSKKRLYAPGLRTLRLAVKVATRGPTCGLKVTGVARAQFLQETPTRPQTGARWAAHVMPLQINYTQPLEVNP